MRLFREPARVVIDNDSSERFTIIDIFAHDRRGLLYAIATTLRELDLSVSLAKIATHLDQVLDVFVPTKRRQSEGRMRCTRTRWPGSGGRPAAGDRGSQYGK
jgi:UTP:GlnB (protein PII) uridylyltransferase